MDIYDIRFEDGYDPYSEKALKFNESLIPKFESKMLIKTVNEWLEIFDKAGVPSGEVKFVEELTDDRQVIENNLVTEIQHSVLGNIKMVGPMLNMSETPLSVNSPAPELGEHTEEVLKAVSYTHLTLPTTPYV